MTSAEEQLRAQRSRGQRPRLQSPRKILAKLLDCGNALLLSDHLRHVTESNRRLGHQTFLWHAIGVDLPTMSAREVIEQLPGLTAAELDAVRQRINELISREAAGVSGRSDSRVLRAERIEGQLVLTGPGIVRQAEVDAILDEFP